MRIETGINRLLCLQEENDCAGVRMLSEAPRFKRLAERHLTGTAPQAISAFNLFQTPRLIAAQMADIVKAHVKPGARILEPSAGLGRLYEPFKDVKELKDNWLMIENARECVRAISNALTKIEIKERDFLTVSTDEVGTFDAVIMNPPFKQGLDIKHINHAYGLLEKGGILISLCYNGTKQNKQLKPIVDTWEVLPEASFKAEGTSASVAMITRRKA